ncbi:MAG: metal-dependent hydrolase [Candidatus Thorarchaeota archaeon]
MTWFTTHLALESLFVWLLIGSSMRKKFLTNRNTRLLFFLTSCASIFPDFDYLLRMLATSYPNTFSFLDIFFHRGASHSMFIPFTLAILGLILIAFGNRESKFVDDPMINLVPLDQRSSTSPITKKFIGQCLLLASVFWGFHIVLDIDAGEGAIMLFWPFDDATYQPQLILNLLAYPFLLLPWTPQGFSINVSHSTIQALQVYLLNWTPQQIVSYFGSPSFPLAMTGLILHSMIFIVYLLVVVKALLSGITIPLPQNYRSFFSKIRKYLKRIPQWVLLGGVIITLIGFATGPLLGPSISDFHYSSSTIQLTPTSFSPFSQVSYESSSQLLDPSAKTIINVDLLNITATNGSIAFFVSSKDNFSNWQSSIYNSFSQTSNLTKINNSTDATFKEDYYKATKAFLSESTDIAIRNITNIISIPQISFQGKQIVSVGFMLDNWQSAPTWNMTDILTQIEFTVNILMERNINYFLGISLQTIGLLMIAGTIIFPAFKKLNELSN